MDERIKYEVDDWLRNITNCIVIQEDWDEVLMYMVCQLLVLVEVEMIKGTSEAERLAYQDKIKSKIQTLWEAYK